MIDLRQGADRIFNNLQFRPRIANVAGYILQGQLSVTGDDAGRVWVKQDQSEKCHQGTK
jgi:hypothetical protein